MIDWKALGRGCLIAVGMWGWSMGKVLAQADFQPGYLVKTDTDTIRGLVSYGGLSSDTRKCLFRTSAQAETETYLPSQVRAYGLVDGAQYEAYTVRQPDGSTHPYFLEVAERGPVSIMLLYDESDKQRYFLRQANGEPVELEEQVQIINRADGRYQQVRKPYLGLLSQAFAGCPAEQINVQKVQLKRSSLTAAARRYNECVTGQKKNAPRIRRPAELSVVAGAVVWHNLTLGNGDGTSEIQDTYPGQGVVPMLGLQFKSPPLMSQRLAIVLGVYYALGYSYKLEDKYYSYYRNVILNTVTRRTSAYLKLDYLQLPFMLRYTTSIGSRHVFVEGGGDVRFVTRTLRNQVINNNNGVELSEELYAGGPRRTNLCLAAGLGVELGKGPRHPTVALIYEVGGGGSPYAIGSLQRMLQMQLAYPLH